MSLIDQIILYLFFIAILLPGLIAGKGIKDVREYTGNKIYGTLPLVLSFLGTYIGIEVFNSATEAHSDGVIALIPRALGCIPLVFIATFVTPHILHFAECISMGEVMGKLYGTRSQVLTGVLGIVHCVLMAGVQLAGFTLVGTLLGIPQWLALPLLGLVFMLYTAYCGMKAVSKSAIALFLFLVTVVPLLAMLAVNRAGGIKEMLATLPAEKLAVASHPRWVPWSITLAGGVLPVLITAPPVLHRLLLAKKPYQLRHQYLVLAFFGPIVRLTIALIGLAWSKLYPAAAGSSLVPGLINTLLPAGMKGLAVVGILAVVLASTSAWLHAAGVLAVHDVVGPLCRYLGRSWDELWWARLLTTLLGGCAIAVSYLSADVLALVGSLAMPLTAALLMVPLLAGIMGVKPDQRCFYISFVATLLAMGVAYWFLPGGLRPIAVLIGTLVSGVSFLGSHLIYYKALVILDRSRNITQLLRPSQAFFQKVLALLPTPARIVEYAQNNVARYGAPYALFGTFFCIKFVFPYFLWNKVPDSLLGWVTYIRFSGAVICALLIVHNDWPQPLKPYVPLFWHFAVLYCLPFSTTFMLLLTQARLEWVNAIFATIIFSIVLVDWVSFLVLNCLGMALAALLYQVVAGHITLQLDMDTLYLLVYQIMAGTLTGLLFASKKEKKLFQKAHILALEKDYNTTELLRILQGRKELTDALESEQGVLQTLTALVRELPEKEKQIRIQAAIDYLYYLTHKTKTYLPVTTRELTLKELLDSTFEELNNRGVVSRDEIYTQITAATQTVECDPVQIRKLLVNSLQYLHTQHPTDMLYCTVQDTTLSYPVGGVAMSIPGVAFSLGIHRVPATNEGYTISEEGYQWYDFTDFGMMQNQQIIHNHYGCMEISSDAHTYVLPVRLQTIRPRLAKAVEKLSEQPSDPAEQTLMDKIKAKNLPTERIEKAIALAKRYHSPQIRKTGEPFYLHPIAVANLLLDHTDNEEAVIAAILHDIVEDTNYTLTQVVVEFGPTVGTIVDQVTHLHNTPYRKLRLSREANIKKLLKEENPLGPLVKLCDRLHNMRTLEGHPSHKQKEIATETVQLFIPLAKLLIQEGVLQPGTIEVELQHHVDRILKS